MGGAKSSVWIGKDPARPHPPPPAPRPLAHPAAWRQTLEPPDAVVPAGVRGAQLSGADGCRALPVLEKARRDNRRASASQHLHSGLRTEHPLLIGGQD